jgi:hypothetical protein
MISEYAGRKLFRVVLTGPAYCRGMREPGFGQAWLDDGRQIYVAEADAQGFDGVVNTVEKLGVNVAEYRQRLTEWVKTGVMPPTEGAN